MIREEKLNGAALLSGQIRHEPRVVFPALTDREAIFEENFGVTNMDPIEEEFVVVSTINIPASPFAHQMASSQLDGDPYTYGDPNSKDEGYE